MAKKLPKMIYEEGYKHRANDIIGEQGKKEVIDLINKEGVQLFLSKAQVYENAKDRVESLTIRLEHWGTP